jgi:hypothetical protein
MDLLISVTISFVEFNLLSSNNNKHVDFLHPIYTVSNLSYMDERMVKLILRGMDDRLVKVVVFTAKIQFSFLWYLQVMDLLISVTISFVAS